MSFLSSGESLRGKRVIIRFDGDVPIRRTQEGKWKIDDTARLEASLPTINNCLERGAKLVLVCHMGRPEQARPIGHNLQHNDQELGTKILAPFFVEALNREVIFFDDVSRVPRHQPEVGLLENLRFWPGEEKNDPKFARLLAKWGDIYINDAMAVLHREHASVTGVPKLLPHEVGLHVQAELKQLDLLLHDIYRPYTVILGGAKASDKSPMIADLADRVDTILIGGLVAVTYMAAMGQNVGKHVCHADDITLAQMCLKKIQAKSVNFLVPVDIVTARCEVKRVTLWGKDDLMLDIGPHTRELFATAIRKSNTLFWNGSVGKFEDHSFAAGTLSVARAMAHADADTKIAAGGDTLGAIHQFKLEKGFTWLSTGGGATLEYIAGRKLPGLEVLRPVNRSTKLARLS